MEALPVIDPVNPIFSGVITGGSLSLATETWVVDDSGNLTSGNIAGTIQLYGNGSTAAALAGWQPKQAQPVFAPDTYQFWVGDGTNIIGGSLPFASLTDFNFASDPGGISNWNVGNNLTVDSAISAFYLLYNADGVIPEWSFGAGTYEVKMMMEVALNSTSSKSGLGLVFSGTTGDDAPGPDTIYTITGAADVPVLQTTAQTVVALSLVTAQIDDQSLLAASGGGAFQGYRLNGPVNQSNTISFVDSVGAFVITVEGATTAAIPYSLTPATLIANIQQALNNLFDINDIVVSGTTLANVILTFSGTGFTDRLVGTVTATILSGSVGYTINGSGTVGSPSACSITTPGDSGTNQVDAIPFVNTPGSGTFSLTVGGTTTAAITYSSDVTTLKTNVNSALNATFGASAIVASGIALNAVVLTFSGTGFTDLAVGVVQATMIAGSTGYTINGSSLVGVPSPCVVTTPGFTATGVVKITEMPPWFFQVNPGNSVKVQPVFYSRDTSGNNNFSHRRVGLIEATILAGSSGYTINGSGTIGSPSTCNITTTGYPATTMYSGVNQINPLPFTDSGGTGTFTLNVEGSTTGVINYNSDPDTLVANIQAALDALFLTNAIVVGYSSSSTLANIKLTFSGTGYSGDTLYIATISVRRVTL